MKNKNQKPANRNEKNPLPSENETQIVQLLLKCGLFLQRAMNQVCQRFGLKQQQFSVLNEIVLHGPISQKDLGEKLLFEKSNVSKIVNILSEKKWIRVVVAPHDGRLTLLSETPEGIAVWKKCMQAFHESSSKFISVLSEYEAVNVIKLLKKLQKAFKRK
ncbi:MAG: winged helix-turn-helix transcriptional regulator [Desulfobacterales bacterium]|nr:MAG: winged helix-turn-helix transcriptional regulator [Desulfobacterales bacterium]